ncbi:MAG: hypothetical protein HQK77_15905 [Desulfobacterales bacterium]|nr:hypothetical protein [Desulfobacterales bacterium]
MVAKEKKLYMGMGLGIGFIVVLFLIFIPIINNKNCLNYLDDLYNSISKQSAYYIPKLKKDMHAYPSHPMQLTVKFKEETLATQAEDLLAKSQVKVVRSGAQLTLDGDLKTIFESSLEDADLLFHNDKHKLQEKYGYESRRVLYNWWLLYKEMDKDLTAQKKFPESKSLNTILAKGIECSYNYYGIEPQSITNKMGIVIFSLVFYVVYTLWYGFALMFLFEGTGFSISH